MAAFETLKITLSCRYWNLKLIVGTQLVKVTSIQHTDKPPKAGDRWDVPVLCDAGADSNGLVSRLQHARRVFLGFLGVLIVFLRGQNQGDGDTHDQQRQQRGDALAGHPGIPRNSISLDTEMDTLL